MRAGCLALVCGLLAVSSFGVAQTSGSSSVTGTKEDEAAIRAVVATQSADQPDPHVAADLDWENAFGIRYFDLQKRNAFYNSIVKPGMKNSTDSSLEVKVKFVEPTVAVADEYWHLAGQVYPGDTKPGADRWGRTTYIFKKENGTWIEVMERVADLRSPYYKHYDAIPAAAPVPPDTLASYAGTYEVAPGRKVAQISVDGDHLTIVNPRGTYRAVPVSSTEFLSFDPNDLAEYYRVTFAKDGDAGVTLTLARASGETLAKATKAKQ
jgi:Domain of unknown function (DUF3471)